MNSEDEILSVMESLGLCAWVGFSIIFFFNLNISWCLCLKFGIFYLPHLVLKMKYSKIIMWIPQMSIPGEWGHQQPWYKQGKSEGFESCDRPIVRKCPIWVKIGDVLFRVTLKFDGWPWKTIGHLSFAVSSFVQHFIAIGEFKLELLSGNTQFGSNSTIFRAVWPWNLTCGLEKQ